MALQSALGLSYYTTLSLWHIFKTFLYLGMMGGELVTMITQYFIEISRYHYGGIFT